MVASPEGQARYQHIRVMTVAPTSDSAERCVVATHSFKRPFIRSFMHSLIHSFIRWFILSFIHSFIYYFIHSFIHSLIRSFIHSFIMHSFVHSFIHSFLPPNRALRPLSSSSCGRPTYRPTHPVFVFLPWWSACRVALKFRTREEDALAMYSLVVCRPCVSASHSLTHSLTRSLTGSLTHSLLCPLPRFLLLFVCTCASSARPRSAFWSLPSPSPPSVVVVSTISESPPGSVSSVEQPWTAATAPGALQGGAFKYFSAVCWLQGKALFDGPELAGRVPVGLLCSAFGGTRVHQWSSREALDACPQNYPNGTNSSADDGIHWNGAVRGARQREGGRG
jgi:hypothetical protein